MGPPSPSRRPPIGRPVNSPFGQPSQQADFGQTSAREPRRAARPDRRGRRPRGAGSPALGDVLAARVERRRDPAAHGARRAARRARHDALEPAVQRCARRVPAGSAARRAASPRGLPPLPGRLRRPPRVARGPAGAKAGRPAGGLRGSPRRRLGHALHGAHDGHGAAAELPDAARRPASRCSSGSTPWRGARTKRPRIGSRRASASCSSPVSPAGSRSGTRRSRFRRWPAWPPASPFRGCARAFAPPRPSRRAWPSGSFRCSWRGSSARAERASRRPRARSRRCGRSGSGPRGSPISATRSRASSASRCRWSWTAASARRFRRSWWRFSLPRCSRPSSPRAARGASPRSSAGRRRSRAPSGSPGGPGRTTCAISTGSMHRSPRSWARASPRSGPLAAPGVPWPVSRSRSDGASARWTLARAWKSPDHAERVWEVPSLDAADRRPPGQGHAQRLREPAVRRPPHARDAGRRDREPGLERADSGRSAALPGRGRPRSRRGLGAVDATVARDAARRRLPRADAQAWAARSRRRRPARSWCFAASGRPTTSRGRFRAPRSSRRRSKARASAPRCSIATQRRRGPRPRGSRAARASWCA